MSERQIERLRQLALKLGCNNEKFLGFKISIQNQPSKQNIKFIDTENAMLS